MSDEPEPVDAEVVPDPPGPEAPPAAPAGTPIGTGTALERRVSQEVLAPLDVAEVAASMEAYQQGLQALLKPDDWQSSGREKFVKKSGWRKIATWFNLSVEPISEHVDRDEDGSPVRARVWVRAVAPNGRTMAGDGACSVDESRFKSAAGRQKLENDLLGTATTRAKNRAISDLVGMGAVSAEEVDAGAPASGPVAATGEQKAACSTALMALLSNDEGAARAAFGELKALTGGTLTGPVADAVALVERTVREKYQPAPAPDDQGASAPASE